MDIATPFASLTSSHPCCSDLRPSMNGVAYIHMICLLSTFWPEFMATHLLGEKSEISNTFCSFSQMHTADLQKRKPSQVFPSDAISLLTPTIVKDQGSNMTCLKGREVIFLNQNAYKENKRNNISSGPLFFEFSQILPD